MATQWKSRLASLCLLATLAAGLLPARGDLRRDDDSPGWLVRPNDLAAQGQVPAGWGAQAGMECALEDRLGCERSTRHGWFPSFRRRVQVFHCAWLVCQSA